jgi:hypothetical protein
MSNSDYVTAGKLKVTTLLKAEELLAIPAPDGQPRVNLRVKLADRTLSADIAAKSVRKAQTAIRTNGVDNVVVVLQGVLLAGDVLGEAGLSAQLKTPKPTGNSDRDQGAQVANAG